MTETAEARPVRTCFIIMPFGPPFDRYYQNIFIPAVRDAELQPLRADSLFRSSAIMADVWRFTREAAALIADLSTRNPNVFYEMGLAHAIGKPIVLVTNNEDDVPFDLKGLRYILYDKNDESWGASLKARITQALKETLKDPKYAIPGMFLERPTVERPTEAPLRNELRELKEEVRALRSSGALPIKLAYQEASLSQNRASGVSVEYIVAQIERMKHIWPKEVVPSQARREVIRLVIAGEDELAMRRLQEFFALSEMAALNVVFGLADVIEKIVAEEMKSPK